MAMTPSMDCYATKPRSTFIRTSQRPGLEHAALWMRELFACGWNEYAQVSSLAVCLNPARAFNCYWEMPFRKRCRITLTNLAAELG